MLKRLNYVWVPIIAAAAVFGVQAISLNAFGVFMVPLTEQFGWGRGALSGAFSMCIFLIGSMGIITGGLGDKYGPRPLVAVGGLLVGSGLLVMSRVESLWQVYLGWGFFLGLGCSCFVTPIMSAIPRWFEEKKGLVLGIATAGMGVGGIFFPILAQWIISSDGWRQSALILGLISFIAFPLAYFLKKGPGKTESKVYGVTPTAPYQPSAAANDGLSFKQAIKSGRFWFFAPIHTCFLFSMQAILAHIVAYAVDTGAEPMAAASIVSIIAASTIVGNLSMGFISDKTGGKPAFIACFILTMMALVWLLFTREIWMFYFFAVLFGLGVGGTNPLVTVVAAELFGLKSLGVIIGSAMLIGTIGGALGATLTGSIFDLSGSYILAFSICLVLSALAVIFSLILLRYKVAGRGDKSKEVQSV